MICEFIPVENEEGVLYCKVCKVKTPGGLVYTENRKPFRSCPADPIGPQKRKKLGIGPHEPTRRRSVSAGGVIPDEFEEDLKEFDVDVKESHGLFSLWEQWGAAIKRWKAAGKPVRSKEEMAQCLSVCKKCDEYDTRMGLPYCKVCGCHVNTSTIGSLNKIRMATENCPKDFWPGEKCQSKGTT